MIALYLKVKCGKYGLYFSPYFKKVDNNISVYNNYLHVFYTDDKQEAIKQAKKEYIYYNVKYNRYEFQKECIVRMFLGEC